MHHQLYTDAKDAHHATPQNDGVSDAPESPIDYTISFEELVHTIKTVKGKPIKRYSDNYWVLFALWRGEVIDDYYNKPTDNEDIQVQNIKSRIGDLSNNYQINIERQRAKGKKYKEYWIEERK